MIVCFISVIGKFMGDVNNLVVRNVGNLFGSGWGISFYIVIVGCIVNVVQVMFQIVVCQCQIINGGYQGGVVISQLQVFYWQFVQQYVFQFYFVEVFCVVVIKVWEVYFSDFILVIQQVQLQFGFFVSFVVVLFKILFVFFVLVEVNRIVWCNYFVIGIKGDSFLFRIVFLVQCINQISSVQYMICSVVIVVFFQYYQYWYVGVVMYIVGEILVWVVEVEFMQYYVVYCQCYCCIGVLFWCQLQIVQFGDFSVVWCDGNSFGFFVMYFSKEVSIWGMCLWYV